MAAEMSKVAPPTEPLAGRSCGGCTLCCKVLRVPAFEKPRGQWCRHCERGVGCQIYESRPGECRAFLCGWLVSERFGPEWKPEQSKIVIIVTRDGNGFDFNCDPGFPLAWRKEPYYSQILHLAEVAVAHDGIVLVTAGKKRTLIAPEGEFPLGEADEDDRVIREFRGKRLISAHVEKAKI